MSDSVVSRSANDPATPSRRGQSLVEFALVLPMLIVLLLGIADFGRVFQAGIVTEAAARSGAESAALERLRSRPDLLAPPDPAYYERLHRIAAQAACAETKVLPNTTYVPDNPSTLTVDEEACPGMPIIAVCVQDGRDPTCGALAPGYTGSPPPQCTGLTQPWTDDSGGLMGSHSVEVRLCYKFTTLFNLNISLPLGWGLSLGDIYLERARTFVVDCAPGDPAGC
jgi:hypothetical protein